MKHEQELDEMQQNQPQPEYSQDHIVRRLISKFRKPSDAGAIGLPAAGSSNLLQVPQPTHGLPTISGQVQAATSGGEGGTSGGASGTGAESGTGQAGGAGGSSAMAVLQRSLAGKQSRWSQLVASAAAGAGAKSSPSAGATSSTGGGATSSSGGHHQPVSSTRSLLDIGSDVPGGESSSNRSSADGRDDEVDENYFRPGGKGHQALLDNMDKR